MMRFRIFVSFAAAVFLVLACGSDPTGSGEPSYGQYSLGWGQDLADPVRDEQLPDGVLSMITCININDEGELEFGIPWQFYYVDDSDTTEVLVVLVQYLGTTNYLWGDTTSIPMGELPDYNDAGPWLDAARDSLGSAYDDWEEYAMTVNANPYPEFPWVSNVAIIQFFSPDTTEQVSAIIDADENDVLAIIQY